MSTDLHSPVINEVCTLAKALADSLVEKGRNHPEQLSLAFALGTAARTIVVLVDDSDATGGKSYAEQVEDLASTAIQVVAEAIHIGDDGYILSEVNNQLRVAQSIVEVLDSIVRSSILCGEVLDWLSDQMHDQLTPLLRLAVQLSDPEKFDGGYVPDPWVQSGATAMFLAAHLSRVISTADVKAREERARTDLAA